VIEMAPGLWGASLAEPPPKESSTWQGMSLSGRRVVTREVSPKQRGAQHPKEERRPGPKGKGAPELEEERRPEPEGKEAPGPKEERLPETKEEGRRDGAKGSVA